MPKLGYIKLGNKSDKHIYECDVVTSMCTDIVEEYTRVPEPELVGEYFWADDYIRTRIKPLAGYKKIHEYNCNSKTVARIGNKIYYSYVSAVNPLYSGYLGDGQAYLKTVNKEYYKYEHGGVMAGYDNYNIYTDTLTDDFYEVFRNVNMELREDKGRLLGYGDVIKVVANNIFKKDKEYIFSFERYLGCNNVRYAYSFTNNTKLHPDINIEDNNLYEADFSYDDSTCVKQFVPKNSDGYRDDVDYYYYMDGCVDYQGNHSYVCIPDTYKSYRKASIRIGYELTYIDGTVEEYLTNNMSSIGAVSGTHVVKFKVKKDVASAKIIVRLAGSFNYGKIFGKLKDLLTGGHYPGIINAQARAKMLDPNYKLIYQYYYGDTFQRPVTDIMCDMAIGHFCLSEVKPFVVETYVSNSVNLKVSSSEGYYNNIKSSAQYDCYINNVKKTDELFFLDIPKYKLDIHKMNGDKSSANNRDVYSDIYSDKYYPDDFYSKALGSYHKDIYFAYAEFVYDKNEHTHLALDNFSFKCYFLDGSTNRQGQDQIALILGAEVLYENNSIAGIPLDRYYNTFGTTTRVMYGVGEVPNIFRMYPMNIPESYHGKKLKIAFIVQHDSYSFIGSLKDNRHAGDYLAFDTFITNNKIYSLDKKENVPIKKLERVFEVSMNTDSYDDYINVNHINLTSEIFFAIDINTLFPGHNFKSRFNVEKAYISGNAKNWKDVSDKQINDLTWGTANRLFDITNIKNSEIIYKSFLYRDEYIKNYHDKEDQSKHSLDMSFEDGKYTIKRYPDIFKTNVGSLSDTFKSFKNLYQEIINFDVIKDMDKKHEWFRLFGIDRESDITDIATFTRSSNKSILIVNSVPINFTNHKLLEYDGLEFIAVHGADISTITAVYSSEISQTNDKDGIYINKNGVVNIERDGILLYSSNNYMVFESNKVNYIPDGYVCSDNLIVTNASGKIKNSNDRVNLLNKIIIVPDSARVYVPIKKCNSMFEEVCKRIYDYIQVDYSSYPNIKDTLSSLHKNIYTIAANQNKDFFEHTYLYPDLETLLSDNNPYPIAGDVESYLYQSKECTRNFVIEESKYDLVLYKDNDFALDVNMPKLMIPYSNPKGYKPVLFLNGILKTASPEVYRNGSTEFIIIDICDVYGKDYREFEYSYNECISWYRKNKVTPANDNIFEVELYPEDTKIVDTYCTKFNDNCVPIPLDFLEEIKVKGDYCFEVYLDGRILHPYYYKLNLFSKKNDLTNSINIPAIYFSKTSTIKMSIGSRVTVIKKKDIRISSYDITSASTPILYNNKFNKYSKFYYSNGRKIPENRMVRLSPNVILFLDLMNDSYKKTFNNLKEFTGSPFIIVSNEIYDLSGTISTHNKFSDDIYSYISSNYYYVYESFKKKNIINDFYTGFAMDKVGYFLNDEDFDAYISMCNNSLKDNFATPVFSDITKISSYTFKNFNNNTIDFNDRIIIQKISYLYSLFVKNFLSSRDINKFSESLLEVDTENSPLRNKQIKVDLSVIAKYNYFVINHLGLPSTVNETSFSLEVLLNNDSPFKKYKSLTFVPLNYGLIPIEWCSRSEPKNAELPVLNTTYR